MIAPGSGAREQGVRVLDRSRVQGSARLALVSAAADPHARAASPTMSMSVMMPLVMMPLVAIRACAFVATASGRMDCLIARGLSSTPGSWVRGLAFELVPAIRLQPSRRVDDWAFSCRSARSTRCHAFGHRPGWQDVPKGKGSESRCPLDLDPLISGSSDSALVIWRRKESDPLFWGSKDSDPLMLNPLMLARGECRRNGIRLQFVYRHRVPNACPVTESPHCRLRSETARRSHSSSDARCSPHVNHRIQKRPVHVTKPRIAQQRLMITARQHHQPHERPRGCRRSGEGAGHGRRRHRVVGANEHQHRTSIASQTDPIVLTGKRPVDHDSHEWVRRPCPPRVPPGADGLLRPLAR